jgi:hypothetical protein
LQCLYLVVMDIGTVGTMYFPQELVLFIKIVGRLGLRLKGLRLKGLEGRLKGLEGFPDPSFEDVLNCRFRLNGFETSGSHLVPICRKLHQLIYSKKSENPVTTRLDLI